MLQRLLLRPSGLALRVLDYLIPMVPQKTPCFEVSLVGVSGWEVENDDGSGRELDGGLIETLREGIWNMAVPKRKTSYSRKRQRQMNPLYGRDQLENFYPCPKCDSGYLKLRHHLCPCDQEKANISGVKKVGWSSLLIPLCMRENKGGLFLFLSNTHTHTLTVPLTTPVFSGNL